MKSFEIDTKGDLIIENGELKMVEGNEELRQSLDRILTTNLEEWFLDIEFGLDYREIQGKGKGVESIKLVITEAIFQDPRIAQVDINLVELDHNRRLSIHGLATDIEGNEMDLSELGVEIID